MKTALQTVHPSPGPIPSPGSAVLTLNAGSSSLRFALFTAHGPLRQLLSGIVQRIGLDAPQLHLNTPTTGLGSTPVRAADHAAALEAVLGQADRVARADDVKAVGHRVLHGGERYSDPHVVDADLLAELKRLRPFGPEHLPSQIELIEALAARDPRRPQVACFDTAFHHDLPPLARWLPLPRRYQAQGVRRYGFHGLSYQFLLEELVRLEEPAASQGKLILAHLGNGASLAAVRDGRSIDTSMGFSPAAGLMMGRRSGDISHENDSEPPSARAAAENERLLARRQLSVGRTDLSLRQSPPAPETCPPWKRSPRSISCERTFPG